MGLANDIERVGYHMRELRIVDDRGERVAAFGTNVFRELTGGRFVTLGRSDLSRLLFGRLGARPKSYSAMKSPAFVRARTVCRSNSNMPMSAYSIW